MEPAYIIDIIRTPIGRYGGALSSVRPDDLAAHVIRELLVRNSHFSTEELEDVVFGAANQAGEDNRNVARMAALMAGLPERVGGLTVNRLCASGLQSIMDVSRSLMLGEAGAFIAGGVESMSRAPFVMAKPEYAYSRKVETYDTTMGWRFINKKLADNYYPYGMGETAENVAVKWGISREDQDQFALESQDKYWKALAEQKFAEEISPIAIPQRKADSVIVDTDEHPRKTSLEQLAKLKPAFKENGTVTAGNSSGINDGASAALLVNEALVKKYNLNPKVRVVSMAITGVHPDIMGIGPVEATRKALSRSGIKQADLGLIELNEAFASQSLACIRDLDLDPGIVNVNGGSIALGHPLGASGTRISATLIHEMKKRGVKYGLATMCVGVGQGAAIIYENCD